MFSASVSFDPVNKTALTADCCWLHRFLRWHQSPVQHVSVVKSIACNGGEAHQSARYKFQFCRSCACCTASSVSSLSSTKCNRAPVSLHTGRSPMVLQFGSKHHHMQPGQHAASCASLTRTQHHRCTEASCQTQLPGPPSAAASKQQHP